MQQLLRGSGILVAALVVVILLVTIVARNVQAASDTNIAAVNVVTNAGNCTQPCWRGIRPGITTMRDAETRLKSDVGLFLDPGYSRDNAYLPPANQLCWNITTLPQHWRGCIVSRSLPNTRSPVDMYLWLIPPSDTIHLGDVMAVFGKPIGVTLCMLVRNNLANLPGRGFMAASVYFEGNIEVIAYQRGTEDRHLAPTMLVASILYHARLPYLLSPHLIDSIRWRGFALTNLQKRC